MINSTIRVPVSDVEEGMLLDLSDEDERELSEELDVDEPFEVESIDQHGDVVTFFNPAGDAVRFDEAYECRILVE